VRNIYELGPRSRATAYNNGVSISPQASTDRSLLKSCGPSAGAAAAPLSPLSRPQDPWRPRAKHLVDAAYVRGRNLLVSQASYQVDLVGPVPADHQWQARTQDGFDVRRFVVDREARMVTCPQGRRSIRWCVTHTAAAGA
jgi:hypothetical protein